LFFSFFFLNFTSVLSIVIGASIAASHGHLHVRPGIIVLPSLHRRTASTNNGSIGEYIKIIIK